MENRDDKALERSKDKLKRDINKRVMDSTDHILTIAEVAIADPQRYKAFRSKVLRAANDAVREVKKDLDLHYQVVYVATNEDVIQVQNPRINS